MGILFSCIIYFCNKGVWFQSLYLKKKGRRTTYVVGGPGLLEGHPIWDLEVTLLSKGFPRDAVVKNPNANAGDARDTNVRNVQSLCQEDSVE